MKTDCADGCLTIKDVYGFVEIVWEIKNFLPSKCKSNWIIQSPEFYVEGPHLTKWRLCLKSELIQERPSVWRHLERLICDSFRGPVQVNWMLSYPYDGGSQYKSEGRATFEINSLLEKKIENLNVLESSLMLRKENTFVVKCSLFVYIIDNSRILARSKLRGLKSLSEDLTILFRVGKDFDTLLKIGYKEMLRVHRAIICSRNRVLKNLIEKQGETVRLDFPNINLEIVEGIICYLYTGDLKYILRKPSFGMMKAINYFNMYELQPYFIPDELTLKTTFDAQEFIFLWTVDISSLRKEHQLLSPELSLGFKNVKFQIVLYPNSVGGEQDYMSIYLQFLDGSLTQDLCLQFGIVDVFERYRNLKCLQWSEECNGELGFENFVSTDILQDPFCSFFQKVKFFCKLEIPKGVNSHTVVNKTCPPVVVEKEKHFDLLSKQIASLFANSNYTDFTIECGVLRFRVHKMILCCRSHVLKDMILKNVNKTSIVLRYTDANIVRKILDYLYSGNVGEYSTTEIMSIYDKAESWAIYPLKYTCSLILSDRFKGGNICRILLAAYVCNDTRLKISAFRFICKNMKEIESLSSWTMLTDGNRDIYEEYMKFKNSYVKSVFHSEHNYKKH